ncbi:PAS domain-containing protein [Ramlibacter sp. CGMCC 1.13660]|nr:PAS domain-containing protein [Ramlibacter sp. CGMCC 1.13660]
MIATAPAAAPQRNDWRETKSLDDYALRLRGNRGEIDALYQDILINVTKFFREPGLFALLKERVFPEILAAKRGDAPIRIWVPGCSTGQEAYSLAMALIEFLQDKVDAPRIQIFATDLSEDVSLQRARAGLYPDSIEADVSPERLRRFFQREDNHYRISKAVREVVVFARQDVAADPPFSHIDLVSCRNLLIYLGSALQRRVIPTFHYALSPGGFMVLGASETIGSHTDLFGVVDATHRVYVRKSGAAQRTYPHFRPDDHRTRAGRGQEFTATPRAGPADWQREADRVATGLYVPPGVLVNENFDILQFRGHTGAFLSPAPGEPSNNLLKMAREGLFVAVRAAVAACQRTGAAVRQPDVRIRGDVADREIELNVVPIKLPIAGEQCYLVLFEEKLHGVQPPPSPVPVDEAADAHHLRQELASTRDYLQSLIQQQAAANEELKAANEEILSSNEELQSTNEELETAKEELQSVNEELTTVNEQLQHRNAELARLNDDIVNLVTSSGTAVLVLDVEARVRRFTPAAGRLLGLLAGDIDRPIGHIKTALDLPDVDALVAQVIATVQPQVLEVRGNDGRTYQLRVHPYRTSDHRIDGAVLALVDISDLRVAQNSLADERDYARAIVETMRESLLVLDQDLRVETANAAFYATFRVDPHDTIGRRLDELGNGQWRIDALHRRLVDVFAHPGEVVEFDVRHEFEGIGFKVMRLGARRIVRDGSVASRILLAIEDRTDIERLAEQVNQHVAELDALDRSRTTFLSLLAHELRNPLAPLRNAHHVLTSPGVREETASRMLGTIDRQVGHLTQLVDDLLDVARIHHGRVLVRPRRIELVELVEEAVESARPGCEAKRVALTAHLPVGPWPIDADPTRLTQVITNLLGNACKFTDAGGQVTVTLQREAATAVLTVADTGIGLAADHLAKIFDLFMQVDPSLERSRSGLGLGLTLARQLIEAHGGTVSVHSAGVGRGSEFVVRLPLPDMAIEAEPPEAAPAQDVAPVAPRRVLVVDDNPDGAQSLALVLETRGHTARVVHDGAAALDLAASWQPDVILLDIGLPGMSGYEVARRLAAQPWRSQMLVVALSGWAPTDHSALAASAGFDARLVKPADIDALARLVASAPVRQKD